MIKKSTIAVGLIAFVAVLLLSLWGVPQYRVYSARMQGKASLQKAEESKLVLIEDAKARLEAAKYDAKAEIERAKGMANAMSIENGNLTTTYNQYLFIRTLQDLAKGGDAPQIIYLPAEGMVPVMDVSKK